MTTGGTLAASGGTLASGGVPAAGAPAAGAPGSGGVAPGGVVPGGTGGGAGGMVAAAPLPPLSACAKTIFTGCATSCHTTALVSFPTIGGGLDLSGDDVAKRLADVTAKNLMATDAAGCGALVNTTVNTESVLLKRIKGMGGCGPQMPLGTPLTLDEQKCLEDWVALF